MNKLSKGSVSIFALIISVITYGVLIVANQHPGVLQNLTNSQDSIQSGTNQSQSASQDNKNVTTPPVNQNEPAINNSSQVSFSDLVINDSVDVKINPNSKIGYNIQMTSAKAVMIMAGWAGDGISVVLTDPKGNVINLTIAQTTTATSATNPMFIKQEGKYMLLYKFDTPITDGTWKILVNNSSVGIIDFGISVTGSSNIMVVPQPASFMLHPGMEFVLSVGVGELSAGNTVKPLTGMSIQADIVDNATQKIIKTIPLYDFKTLGIGIAGIDPFHTDGIYESNYIRDSLLPGHDYNAYYTVKGKNSRGQQVTIKGGEHSYIMISSDDAAILDNPIDQGLDVLGDGTSGAIQVNIWIVPKVAGHYILAGTFVSPDGQEERKASNFDMDGSGPMQATLILENTKRFANGVYKLKDIQLFEVTNQTRWVDNYVGGTLGDGIYIMKSYTVK